MATLGKGYTFGATEQVTSTKLHNLVDNGTVTEIANADIATDAAVAESKVAWDDSTGHTHSGSGDGTKVDLSAPGAIGGTTPAAGTFSTLTGTTTSAGTLDASSLELATGATCTGIADEDDMSSDSATLLATQQSIKAYVDSSLPEIPLWNFALCSDSNATGGSTAGINSFTSSAPADPNNGEKYAWCVEGSSYQTILRTKFKKSATVDTVTFYVYMACSAASGTQYCNVDVGGQATEVSADGATSPAWLTDSIDVSSLSDGTVYDVQIQLKHNSGATVALYSTIAYGS